MFRNVINISIFSVRIQMCTNSFIDQKRPFWDFGNTVLIDLIPMSMCCWVIIHRFPLWVSNSVVPRFRKPPPFSLLSFPTLESSSGSQQFGWKARPRNNIPDDILRCLTLFFLSRLWCQFVDLWAMRSLIFFYYNIKFRIWHPLSDIF